jgi:uncharacterized membrane protein
MRKETWLQREMLDWQAENLLSEQQAQAILARYATRGSHLARTLFSVIGAVVFGLGVILFFAWNWASMGHLSKLGVIFTALLTAHFAGAYYRQRGQVALGEGLSALGTLLFGSGIFLISQIYHIDEHYPNAFLVWGSGALLLAWALPSVVQGVIACILYALWLSFEVLHFQTSFEWAAPLLAVTLLPLAWLQRSRLLFRLALLTVVYALLVALLHRPDHRVFVDCMLIAFTLVAVRPMIRRSAFPAVADIPRDVGYAGYLVLLVMLAFREGSRLLHWASAQSPTHDDIHGVYFYTLAGMALLAAFGALRTIAQARPVARVNFAILLLTTLLVALASEGVWVTSYALWVWANVAALVHAVLWIIDGAHTQQSRKVTLACLLFAAIAIPRFLDLFDSLLMRSLMFLALGAGLFLVGNFYQRQKTPVVVSTEVPA